MKTTSSILVAAALAMLSSWATAQQITNEQCKEHFVEYRNGYRTATEHLTNAETQLTRQQATLQDPAATQLEKQQALQDLLATQTKKQQALQDQGKYQRLFAQFLNLSEQAGCMVNLILTAYPGEVQKALRTQLFLGFVSTAEKQAGSSSSTAGSTDLISKNFTSRLLSVADQYGALTSSTSGQTTTISGSLDQLFTAIEGASKGEFTECAVKTVPGAGCLNSGIVSFLGRVSYSTSLDLSQPSTITGTAAGTAQGGTQQVTGTQGGNSFALSQFTAKFYIWAQTPTKQDLANALKQSSYDDTSALTARNKLVVIQTTSDKSGAWTTWLRDAAGPDVAGNLLTSSDETIDADLAAKIRNLIDILAPGSSDPDQAKAAAARKPLIQAALAYSGSLASIAKDERTLYDKAAWAKPILTLEYDYNTPSNQPTNSTLRLIWGQSLKSWKMTGNVAGSIYNSIPSSLIPGSGRLRDIQAGVEADHNPYNLGSSLTATFSAAYYFQDQTSPAILNVTPSSPISGVTFTGLSSTATQVFTQKGKIHVGQLKITLGNSSSGWKFPIAITGSNRSELITKSTIGAQVGISYDFDSLFSGKK
jgi:hypothetical protein